MLYTNIPKPVTPTYSNTNVVGKEQYDQDSILYDDTTVFYDGVNQSLYTNVTKPTLPSYTNVNKPS